MKKLALASVAVIALSLPAFANDQDMSNGSTGRMHDTNATQTQPQSTNLSPPELNKDVIMQVQQALNDKGFEAGDVDGIWGPDTVAAVKKFQQENNLKADGNLDDRTVAALGLGGRQQPTTTGSGVSNEPPDAAQPSDDQSANEKPTTGAANTTAPTGSADAQSTAGDEGQSKDGDRR